MKARFLVSTILFILLFTGLCSADYERVNVSLPTMDPEPVSTLDKATGWMFNDLGQWESGENEIPGYSYKPVDNFHKFFLSNITIENHTYNILIRLKYSTLNYYVFNNSELNKFLFSDISAQKLISVNLIYLGEHHVNLSKEANLHYEYLKTEIEEDIQRVRLTEDDRIPKNHTNVVLNFNILPLKNKDVVRFIMFVSDDSYNKIFGFIDIPSIDIFNEIPEGKDAALNDNIFNRCYYETDYNTFNNFIPLTREGDK